MRRTGPDGVCICDSKPLAAAGPDVREILIYFMQISLGHFTTWQWGLQGGHYLRLSLQNISLVFQSAMGTWENSQQQQYQMRVLVCCVYSILSIQLMIFPNGLVSNGNSALSQIKNLCCFQSATLNSENHLKFRKWQVSAINRLLIKASQISSIKLA